MVLAQDFHTVWWIKFFHEWTWKLKDLLLFLFLFQDWRSNLFCQVAPVYCQHGCPWKHLPLRAGHGQEGGGARWWSNSSFSCVKNIFSIRERKDDRKFCQWKWKKTSITWQCQDGSKLRKWGRLCDVPGKIVMKMMMMMMMSGMIINIFQDGGSDDEGSSREQQG